jgi:hypothetical protein
VERPRRPPELVREIEAHYGRSIAEIDGAVVETAMRASPG